MADYASLIDRVRSGSGADRGIDGEVALIVGWKFHFGSKQYDPEWPDMGGHWLPPDIDADVFKCSCRSDRHFDVPPAYTSSLDAVVRLVEEKLPGWGYQSGRPIQKYGATGWYATVFREQREDERGEPFAGTYSCPKPLAGDYASTQARALLGALLLALQAQEAS